MRGDSHKANPAAAVWHDTEQPSDAKSLAAGTKQALLETGAKIEVPPFIEAGDIIKVDTKTDEYIQRV